MRVSADRPNASAIARQVPSLCLLLMLLVSFLSLPGAAGVASHGPVVLPFAPGAGEPHSIGTSPTEAPAAIAAAQASLAAGHGPRDPARLPSALPRALASPGAGQFTALAYDAADGYVLALAPNITVVSNVTTYGPVCDTWEFLSGNWTQLAPPLSPPERAYESMTYDPTDGYVLMFGGIGLGGFTGLSGYHGDTWSYVGGTWTNRTASITLAPAPRAYAPMVWDTADGYALMVGGTGYFGNISTNTSQDWSYVGGNWTLVGSGYTWQDQGSLSDDPVNDCVVYFGGLQSHGGASDATWSYHAGVWVNITSALAGSPTARLGASMNFDPNLKQVLLFGGLGNVNGSSTNWVYYNDTWAYANLTWTLLSSAAGPSPRELAPLVFDAADNESILFGGINYFLSTPYSDTWAFHPNGTGTNVPGVLASSPTLWGQSAPRVYASPSAIDVGASVTFRVWGVQGTGATYSYAGLPPGCWSADTPALTCVPTANGTYDVSVSVLTSTGSASMTTRVGLSPTLQVVSLVGSPSLSEVGANLTFRLSVAGGAPPLSFRWAGLPAGCAGADQPTITCSTTSAGSSSVSANVTDANGAALGASTSVQVLPHVAITSLGAYPATIDLTLSTDLALHQSGGLAPYAYTYGGLPQGCSSSNASAVACTPTATGSYTVTAELVDGLGYRASGSAVLVVNPDPSIGSFRVSAANVTLGDGVTFTTTAAGGTGGFAYQYSGLPPGCSAVNRSSITCTPNSTGTFLVSVTATDAFGLAASAQVTVEISRPPISPPGSGAPGGSGGSATTSSGGSPALFYAGLSIGLLAFVLGSALLLRYARRARLARQGREIIRKLRSQPKESGPGENEPRTGRRGGDTGVP